MEGLIVLIAFTAAFTGIAIWAYLPRNKLLLQRHGCIPFTEDRHDG